MFAKCNKENLTKAFGAIGVLAKMDPDDMRRAIVKGLDENVTDADLDQWAKDRKTVRAEADPDGALTAAVEKVGDMLPAVLMCTAIGAAAARDSKSKVLSTLGTIVQEGLSTADVDSQNPAPFTDDDLTTGAAKALTEAIIAPALIPFADIKIPSSNHIGKVSDYVELCSIDPTSLTTATVVVEVVDPTDIPADKVPQEVKDSAEAVYAILVPEYGAMTYRHKEKGGQFSLKYDHISAIADEFKGELKEQDVEPVQ